MRTILILLVIFLVSCNVFSPDTREGPASLRIINTGNIDFQSVIISFTGPEVQYGELASREVSEYKLFEEAYHYGFIEVVAQDKTYRLVPIDYVGESPLEPGLYTYELKIEENDLLFRFVK